MIPEGKRAEKRRRADEYINGLLRQLNPGEALPPMRTLMQDSCLGRNVLENAIHEQLANNQLTSKARSGFFRTYAGVTQNNSMVVDIVACSEIGYLDDPSLFVADLVNCLLAEGSAKNFSIRIQRVSYYSPVSVYEELIRQQNIQNAILLLPHHNDIAKVFELADVNHIVLLPRYYPTTGVAIVDPVESVRAQMNYLITHGHSRIACIHTVDAGFSSLADSSRREEYYRIMAENGFRVHPDWVIHYSYDEKVMFERLEHLFRAPVQPTAILIADQFAAFVYHFCIQKGLVIGRDISLISLGGFERNHLYPKLVTLVHSRKTIARLAWEMFIRAREDRNYHGVECFDIELEDGDSVADLNSKDFRSKLLAEQQVVCGVAKS